MRKKSWGWIWKISISTPQWTAQSSFKWSPTTSLMTSSKCITLRTRLTQKGFVILQIEKGMYGLPCAGIIVQELLTKWLEKHDYTHSDMTPGCWTHKWGPISFTLTADDFGVKYVGKEHADHLISVLEEHYLVKQDWLGKKHCGITLRWGYNRQKVNLSMPEYCSEALTRIRHKAGKCMDHPLQHAVPVYGAKVQ